MPKCQLAEALLAVCRKGFPESCLRPSRRHGACRLCP